jgi:hypothetical protein
MRVSCGFRLPWLLAASLLMAAAAQASATVPVPSPPQSAADSATHPVTVDSGISSFTSPLGHPPQLHILLENSRVAPTNCR